MLNYKRGASGSGELRCRKIKKVLEKHVFRAGGVERGSPLVEKFYFSL